MNIGMKSNNCCKAQKIEKAEISYFKLINKLLLNNTMEIKYCKMCHSGPAYIDNKIEAALKNTTIDENGHPLL